MLSLISKVEASQTFRYSLSPVDRQFENDCRFVALADKLEGLWLDSKPGGVEGVLKRLRSDQSIDEDCL